jgi:hypothetical protein
MTDANHDVAAPQQKCMKVCFVGTTAIRRELGERLFLLRVAGHLLRGGGCGALR